MIFPLLLASMGCQLCDNSQLSVNIAAIHINGQHYNNFWSTFKPFSFPPQDDLPPPARLLPPDPHAHPPKDNRVKVPSGKLFNQGLLLFLVFIIGFESLSARCWTGCILDIERLPRESTVCRFFVLFGFQLFGGA